MVTDQLTRESFWGVVAAHDAVRVGNCVSRRSRLRTSAPRSAPRCTMNSQRRTTSRRRAPMIVREGVVTEAHGGSFSRSADE